MLVAVGPGHEGFFVDLEFVGHGFLGWVFGNFMVGKCYFFKSEKEAPKSINLILKKIKLKDYFFITFAKTIFFFEKKKNFFEIRKFLDKKIFSGQKMSFFQKNEHFRATENIVKSKS